MHIIHESDEEIRVPCDDPDIIHAIEDYDETARSARSDYPEILRGVRETVQAPLWALG